MHKQMIHLLLATAIALSSCSDRKTNREMASADTLPSMVMQIQKCAKLYTTEVRVHKIITHDDAKRLKGSLLGQNIDLTLPLSKRKIAIPIDATLKAYVDFSHFSEDNITRRGKRIEITLPDPKIELTATRISHRQIKRYVSLARTDFSDEELASYERQGRQAILRSIPQMNLLEQARANAAKVIIPMILQMGYREEDITVSFRKRFTPSDLPTLLHLPNDEKTSTDE